MLAAFPVGLGTRLRHLLERLDADVQRIYDEMDVGFRPRFYPVVLLLVGHGPQNVNAIAEHVGVSQPAITQTLGEMKKLGLIESESGADRRQKIIRLSTKGESLAKNLEPVWNATHRAAAQLESELPVGLGEIVDKALAALDRQPFKHRVRAEIRETT